MSRKSKSIKLEALNAKKLADEAAAKALEVEQLLKKAEEEEIELLTRTTDDINTIVSERNMFCGVILAKEDILNLVSLAIDTQESIRIPFRLYYNE